MSNTLITNHLTCSYIGGEQPEEETKTTEESLRALCFFLRLFSYITTLYEFANQNNTCTVFPQSYLMLMFEFPKFMKDSYITTLYEFANQNNTCTVFPQSYLMLMFEFPKFMKDSVLKKNSSKNNFTSQFYW